MKNDFYQLVIDKVEILPAEKGYTLLLWGWTADGDSAGHEKFRLNVNGKPALFRVRRTPRSDVAEWYATVKEDAHPGFIIRADLPEETLRSVSLQVNDRPERTLSESVLTGAWNPEGVDVHFDFYHVKPGWISAGGWFFSLDPEKAKFEVLDANGNPVEKAKVALGSRFDVERAYFVKEERVTGFSISIRQEPLPVQPLQLRISNKRGSWTFPIAKNSGAGVNWSDFLRPEKIKNGWQYLRMNGIRPLLSRIRFSGRKPVKDFNEEYNKWFLAHRTGKDELERQRRTKFEKNPRISLIVAAYNTPIDLLEKMIDSVREQTYSNWQLCIADGSTNDNVENWLKTHPDPNIAWTRLRENLGISGNMNAAKALADGDYIALYDHDDFLEPDALYQVVKSVNEKEYAFIYTDEDKYEDASGRYVGPNFKPDFSPALLLSTNYICHFLAIRRDVYEKVGDLRSEYDGAQDYDLVLRLMEACNPEDIHHIPQILYHWRMHEGSTALDSNSKLWAYEAGERALTDWARRNHVEGKLIDTGFPGQYHFRRAVQGNPLVSIIIPNKDHSSDLRICIDSIMRRAKYKNFEIVVVENNSVEEETFGTYKALESEYPKVRIVTWEHPFNYSAINNFGVRHARGDYYLFLNNDTEAIDGDFITEMLGQMQQPDVGAVGAKLYFEDGTIQHLGVILGHSGIAGHGLIGHTDLSPNYRVRTMFDVSAVTAACLMTSKKVFEETGGFNEDLPVAYNDIDFCLRIRRLGYRIIENPFAVMYHYESLTRGSDETDENRKRFEKEVRQMYALWPDELRTEDPYYNRNLDLTGVTYQMREDGEVNPYINPDFLGEAYYTAGTIRPPRPEKGEKAQAAEHKEV